jgi:lysyl-tRNA synthetase class II
MKDWIFPEALNMALHLTEELHLEMDRLVMIMTRAESIEMLLPFLRL